MGPSTQFLGAAFTECRQSQTVGLILRRELLPVRTNQRIECGAPTPQWRRIPNGEGYRTTKIFATDSDPSAILPCNRVLTCRLQYIQDPLPIPDRRGWLFLLADRGRKHPGKRFAHHDVREPRDRIGLQQQRQSTTNNPTRGAGRE